MWTKLGCNIVKYKSENVVLNEEWIARRLEDKVLHERLWRIVVSLQLAHNVDQDAAIEHRVAVNRGDDVVDSLQGEGVDLFHDLDSALYLLPLKAEKTLFRIVQRGQLTPGGGVVEHTVVLGHKPGYNLNFHAKYF